MCTQSGVTSAIHVYGGDFFCAERSEWDPETLEEGRYDAAKTMRMFEEANARRAVLGVVPMRRASFNRAIEMSLPFNVKLLFISHPVLTKRK